MRDRHLSLRAALIALVLAASFMASFVAASASAQATGFRTYEPATVDPPIARPATRSCDVPLFTEHGFAGEPEFRSAYRPPAACPGPWSKVILTVDTHVKGRQYDRVGRMALDRYEILRFSTAEPTRHGIRYRIEKDVTAYSALLRSPRMVSTELGNVVNATYTGIFSLSARLRFYTTSATVVAPVVADAIEPFAPPAGDSAVANGFHVTFAHLPENIAHAVLDLYASNHGCDEFWYSNQSDAYVRQHPHHELCGGGPYREIDVFLDRRPVNVVYPFPYIWTGGVNPMLWRPLSAYHTLNVPAYAVDLDPVAGVLSDGKPHTLAVQVWNDRGSWFIEGSLMLWTDRHARHTGGALTADTIAVGIATSTTQQHTAAGETFTWSGKKQWSISGYVDTAHGRVEHRIDDRMTFDNAQIVNIASGRGDATQKTIFTRRTIARDATGVHESTEITAYPLVVNATYPPPTKASRYGLMIFAEVHQGMLQRGTNGRCSVHIDGTATFERERLHDTGVESGTTVEKNVCRGSAGDFSIVKAAHDGALRAIPLGGSR